MGKNKLMKFAKNETFSNMIQPEQGEVLRKDFKLKGKWREEFGNTNPIVLELACGKGEYTVGQARLYPEKNFIGIDIKGARLFSGAKESLEEGLTNVRFIRTKIDLITSFFAQDEVDEIWITFADPQIQKPRKRLTSQLFLDRYIQFLKVDSTLNLKTDSDELYEFTRDESIPEFNAKQQQFHFSKEFDTDQLYESGIHELDPTMQNVLNIRTYYEQMWLEQGKKIKYLRYKLN
jgi:tRNA (guanine-N7-)-methyltransferase